MKFLKRILSSTPIILIFVLAVICVGFILLFTGIVLIASYLEIFVSFLFFLFIGYLLLIYKKFRKPSLWESEYTPESEKQHQLVLAKNWKDESRFTLIFGLLVSGITVANYWNGFVAAPFVFFLYGSFCIYILYLCDYKGQMGVSNLKSTSPQSLGNVNSSNFVRTVINYFVVLTLISGYWLFQIQKNESSQKESGFATILNLSDYRYCSSSENICGAVDSIKNVRFLKVKSEDSPGKIMKMCSFITFKYSINESDYREDWEPEEVCIKPSTFGGYWSEYESQEAINVILKSKIG
jgi:hypothetical protein